MNMQNPSNILIQSTLQQIPHNHILNSPFIKNALNPSNSLEHSLYKLLVMNPQYMQMMMQQMQ